MLRYRFTYRAGLGGLMIVLGMLLLGGGNAAAADDIEVSVSLNRDTIGLDEQALMTVEVSGSAQNLPKPQLSSLPMFEVYSQGHSSNISIVNGQVSSSVTYRYLLLPQKAGVFPIDQVAVVHNNKRYRGNAVQLTVLDQGSAPASPPQAQTRRSDGKTRDYFLEAVVDNEEPFVNEQVTLTLKLYIATKFYGSPQLSEPATTGFWTELLGNKAPYFQMIDGRRYRIIERKYALFPTQTGKLTIGRAAIQVTVPARRRRSRDPFGSSFFDGFFESGEEVTLRSRPIEIDVKPLPQQGKPSDFTGTIGKFSISARADKYEVDVNQPVTVTIRIRGVGNIKSVAEPIIPELDDFRVYSASSNEKLSTENDVLGGVKSYEKVFIPRRPGDLEIPAFSFNYFDPARRRYEVLTTRPIGIKVIRPEGYVAESDVPFPGPDMTISSEAREIRHIKSDPGSLQPQDRLVLFSPLYIVVNGLPVLALVGLVVVRKRRERLSTDVGYARARTASREARKRLQRARSLASPDQAEPFYAEVHRALSSYIADKLNISPHGLTTDRIAALLRERIDDEDFIAAVGNVLQECDFARFAPARPDQETITTALTRAEQVMTRLEGIRFA